MVTGPWWSCCQTAGGQALPPTVATGPTLVLTNGHDVHVVLYSGAKIYFYCSVKCMLPFKVTEVTITLRLMLWPTSNTLMMLAMVLRTKNFIASLLQFYSVKVSCLGAGARGQVVSDSLVVQRCQ